MSRNINSANKIRPLEKKRTFMEIADQLRELVYNGAFKPGDKLPPERELGVLFNSGRLAVREALRVLENSGFITIRQGKHGGAFIEAIGSKIITRSLNDFIRLGNVSLQDLTEARMEIELTVAKYAIKRITPEGIAALNQNIVDTMKLGKDKKDTAENNINFHMLLAKSAKNRLLETVLAGILDFYGSFLDQWEVSQDFRTYHVNEHANIFEALKSEDVDLFKSAVKSHILSIGDYFSKAQKKR